MEGFQSAQMAVMLQSRNVLMAKNPHVLMDQRGLPVLTEIDQSALMELFLASQHVRTEILLFVRMGVHPANPVDDFVMTVVNHCVLMEIALYAQMEQQLHPVMMEIVRLV